MVQPYSATGWSQPLVDERLRWKRRHGNRQSPGFPPPWPSLLAPSLDTGDMFLPRVTFWAGTGAPVPGSRAHTFQSRPRSQREPPWSLLRRWTWTRRWSRQTAGCRWVYHRLFALPPGGGTPLLPLWGYEAPAPAGGPSPASSRCCTEPLSALEQECMKDRRIHVTSQLVGRDP